MIALIVALLYPIPLHCCDGVAPDLDVVLMTGIAGRGDGAISCCTQDPVPCVCAKHGSNPVVSIHSATSGMDMPQIAGSGPGCDCSSLPYFAVDSALLASPTLLPSPALLPFALPALTMESLPDPEPCAPIGSPPPYLAAISHYIYLSTSVLLI